MLRCLFWTVFLCVYHTDIPHNHIHQNESADDKNVFPFLLISNNIDKSCLLSGFASSSLCFLDVFLQVRDAKALFLRLEERGLLDNHIFLSQLLHTIRRADLLSLLETDSRQPVETDANPLLSEYR